MDKKHCSGCEDNFYNQPGNSNTGECWSLKDATRESYLLIPVDLPPPYLHIKPEQLPTCYRAKRCVKVKPDRIDSRGFWK